MAYREAGRGPAIVLIPGWTMPAFIWDGQLDRLAPEFRAVAVDLRGQGGSGPWTGPPRLAQTARDLERVIRGLGLGPVVVVGWSLGAEVALAWADLPGRTAERGLVLVDEPIAPDPHRPRSGEFRRRLRADRGATTRSFVRAMFRRPVDPARLDELTGAALAVPDGTCLAMLGFRFPRPAVGRVLDGLECGAVYVHAGSERDIRNLRTWRPGLRLEVFPDAGHAVFMDEPDRFAALVRAVAAACPR